ncbi:MAG: addiction module toxin RelE [Desulfobacula sp.]|jgi:phage-related protein|uniref:type II toxin-antitoxin system RelE/ParE family toxin n=2 Tax=Desulfobacula sp. TaxID=2593537 RepID=UPI001D775BA5|nr:addiction module toxin RelE [Desulfobacteraceae bacterium]MBT4639475.1 addiction module toxin RelE [Deltaproteobacteria bacterium]MBT6499293.1 addiction module toxin RelE [Deltaproteobacteria bacterium]MBT6751695.1 addiction module toxin RelE [Desulfobacula sp.]MBT7715935.1 addiction module toxin RelE [Deltaproteobacteria bacterium]
MKKLKPIEWMGTSIDDLKEFPEPVKDEIGFALHRAQEGEKHKNAKPLTSFSGVFEIVSQYMSDTYRAVYAVKISNTVYVLHAFQKKSQKGKKTPKPDIKIIKQRLKDAKLYAEEK